MRNGKPARGPTLAERRNADAVARARSMSQHALEEAARTPETLAVLHALARAGGTDLALEAPGVVRAAPPRSGRAWLSAAESRAEHPSFRRCLSEALAAVLAATRAQRLTDGSMLSALAVVVEGIPAQMVTSARPLVPTIRGGPARLPKIPGAEPASLFRNAHPASEEAFPALFAPGPGAPPDCDVRFPLFPEAGNSIISAPLLELADRTGAPVKSGGRGAPPELLLLVGLVLMVSVTDRKLDRPVPLKIPARDIVRRLAGPRPRGGPAAFWRRLRVALERLNGASFQTVQGGEWIPWKPFAVYSAPIENLKEAVRVVVWLPPGSADGPPIDRRQLFETGRSSGPRFRVAVGVHSTVWLPGRTRVPPRKGRHGAWVGDPRRYPVFTSAARLRMAFGPAAGCRGGSAQAGRQGFRQSDADAVFSTTPGVQVIDTDARDFQSGARGWRVVPDAAAAAVRKRERREAAVKENDEAATRRARA